MDWNESSDGFPPEEPPIDQAQRAWGQLHTHLLPHFAARAHDARERALIHSTQPDALHFEFTKDPYLHARILSGGLFVEMDDSILLQGVDSAELAATLRTLSDNVRETIGAFLVWGCLRREYKELFCSVEDEGTKLDEDDEDNTWEKSDDAPWENGMESDDESWRGDEHPAAAEDDEDPEFDPHLLQIVIDSLPELRGQYKAIVEGRVQPDDLHSTSQH